MAPDWTSHVFTGPGRPGALEPVLASWDIQVSSHNVSLKTKRRNNIYIIFQGLEERQGYEARVQAKNRYKKPYCFVL